MIRLIERGNLKLRETIVRPYPLENHKQVMETADQSRGFGQRWFFSSCDG